MPGGYFPLAARGAFNVAGSGMAGDSAAITASESRNSDAGIAGSVGSPRCPGARPAAAIAAMRGSWQVFLGFIPWTRERPCSPAKAGVRMGSAIPPGPRLSPGNTYLPERNGDDVFCKPGTGMAGFGRKRTQAYRRHRRRGAPTWVRLISHKGTKARRCRACREAAFPLQPRLRIDVDDKAAFRPRTALFVPLCLCAKQNIRPISLEQRLLSASPNVRLPPRTRQAA